MKATSRFPTRIVIVLSALAAVMMPATVATAGASSAYPPTTPPIFPVPGRFDPAILLDSTTVVAGAQFTVTVTPCVRGTIFPMTFNGRTINAVCTNPHAIGTFRAPSKAGVYPLTIKSYFKVTRIDITVTSGSGDGLPGTGASGLPTKLTVGAVAVVAGLGLLVVARRRQRIRRAG